MRRYDYTCPICGRGHNNADHRCRRRFLDMLDIRPDDPAPDEHPTYDDRLEIGAILLHLNE